MSYTIEYNRVVYKREDGLMLLLIKQGDNNVYDQNNQRAKDWSIIEVGSEKDLWKRIGKRSGSTVGGTLQRAKGWSDAEWFDIEDYIKLYRTKINRAKPFEKILEDFNISFVFYLAEDHDNEEHKDEHKQYLKDANSVFETIVEKYDLKSYRSHYYNESRKEYVLYIKSLDVLSHTLDMVDNKFLSYGTSHFRLDARKTKI